MPSRPCFSPRTLRFDRRQVQAELWWLFALGQANASTWLFRVRIIPLMFILVHLSPALYNLSNWQHRLITHTPPHPHTHLRFVRILACSFACTSVSPVILQPPYCHLVNNCHWDFNVTNYQACRWSLLSKINISLCYNYHKDQRRAVNDQLQGAGCFCSSQLYSATQEIPVILRNPTVHYPVHNSPPVVPVRSNQSTPSRADFRSLFLLYPSFNVWVVHLTSFGFRRQ